MGSPDFFLVRAYDEIYTDIKGEPQKGPQKTLENSPETDPAIPRSHAAAVTSLEQDQADPAPAKVGRPKPLLYLWYLMIHAFDSTHEYPSITLLKKQQANCSSWLKTGLLITAAAILARVLRQVVQN